MTLYYFWRQPIDYPNRIVNDPKDEPTLHKVELSGHKKAVEYKNELERRDNNGRVWNLEDSFKNGYNLYMWTFSPFSQARDLVSFNKWKCNED